MKNEIMRGGEAHICRELLSVSDGICKKVLYEMLVEPHSMKYLEIEMVDISRIQTFSSCIVALSKVEITDLRLAVRTSV